MVDARVDAALEENPLYRVLQAVRRVTEQEPLEIAGTKLFIDDDDVKMCKCRVFISHTRSYVQELGWDLAGTPSTSLPRWCRWNCSRLLESGSARTLRTTGDVEAESGNTIGFRC